MIPNEAIFMDKQGKKITDRRDITIDEIVMFLGARQQFFPEYSDGHVQGLVERYMVHGLPFSFEFIRGNNYLIKFGINTLNEEEAEKMLNTVRTYNL